MKLNWGTSIAIFYICFMAVMITMVVKSAQNNVDLVQENYYEKDLNYEAFRTKRENGLQMSNQVKISYEIQDGNIRLVFPEEMNNVSGQVALFRPSNKKLDRQFDLKLESNGEMLIPVDNTFQAGLWKVYIDWESHKKLFFSQDTIVI